MHASNWKWWDDEKGDEICRNEGDVNDDGEGHGARSGDDKVEDKDVRIQFKERMFRMGNEENIYIKRLDACLDTLASTLLWSTYIFIKDFFFNL